MKTTMQKRKYCYVKDIILWKLLEVKFFTNDIALREITTSEWPQLINKKITNSSFNS